MGGLHVIATERHDARRIDRQLFGRCGRQGDPWSYESFASLEDEILSACFSSFGGRLVRRALKFDAAPNGKLGEFLTTLAQRVAERKHFHIRRDLLKFDESLDEAMGFAGHGE